MPCISLLNDDVLKVKCVLNNKAAASALVDCGAGANVVHPQVLKGLDVIVNTAHRRRFKVANCGSVDSLGTVRLRLRLGQWEDREHVFHVLPNLVCDCLLGVPWLNATGAAVRGSPNGLVLCPPRPTSSDVGPTPCSDITTVTEDGDVCHVNGMSGGKHGRG